MNSRVLKFGLPCLAVVGASMIVWAQVATPAQMSSHAGKSNMATLHMQCKLGSFKTIDGVGRIEVKFKGTMLVTKLDGTATPSPGLKLEYDEGGRKSYSGEGSIVIDGKWRGVQWLGSDMSAVFYGNGITRISGDFWKNPATGELETGKYWYDDPEEWQPFPSQGIMNVVLPQPSFGADKNAKPRVRGGSSGGQ